MHPPALCPLAAWRAIQVQGLRHLFSALKASACNCRLSSERFGGPCGAVLGEEGGDLGKLYDYDIIPFSSGLRLTVLRLISPGETARLRSENFVKLRRR